MYKFLSIILAVAVVVAGVFYAVERSANSKELTELYNKIAELEGVIQETETVASRRATEISNLESENKELQNIIEKRNEEIVSLSEARLRWKNKYFEIKNATETIVGEDGEEVEISENCEDELKDKRFRVDFDKSKDYLRVFGHTLTNPAFAEVHLEWIRDLKLNIILTKDDNDKFKIYLDTGDSDLEVADLALSVDPSILDVKWYERMAFGAQTSVGPGVMTSVAGMLQFYDNWIVGPNMVFLYDGETENFKKFYGVNVVWFPFK